MHKTSVLFASLTSLSFLAACSSSAPDHETASAPAANVAHDAPSTDASTPALPAPDAGTVDAAEVGDATPEARDARTAGDAAPSVVEATDGDTVTLDLVSPKRCALDHGRLGQCSISPTLFDLALSPDAAVANGRFHTTATAHFEGDCSTRYPLAVGMSAPDLSALVFHLEDGTLRVQADDGARLSSLLVADGTSWTGYASYDQSCRAWVTLEINRPN